METKEPAVSYSNYYTLEQYQQLEADEVCRYEYWQGQVFAMAGASLRHAGIAANLLEKFRQMARAKGCRAFQIDVKLELVKDGIYVYPDIVFTCNPDDLNAEYIVRNPSILVEVLSPGTQGHDLGDKWDQYRKLRSLRYMLFVSQDKMLVQLYHRTNQFSLFTYQAYTAQEEIIDFQEFGFQLTVEQVYEDVHLEINKDTTIEKQAKSEPE
jgi:Uma2 family endonuclease